MVTQTNIKVSEIVEKLGPLIEGCLGKTDIPLHQFATTTNAESGSLGFINSPKNLQSAEDSHLSCILAPLQMKEQIEALNSKKTWLFSKNVDLAAREAKKLYFFRTPYQAPMEGIHPTAVVDPSAEISNQVVIGPHAFIGKHVKIGTGSFIGANSVVEENCELAENVTIHPLAYIGHGTLIGKNCEIMPQAIIASEGFGYAHDHLGNHYRIPHTGRVILEDDVHVGAATAIDRGTIEDTRIGRGTKLDNHVHLAHNTVIGKNGLITAQVVTAGSTTIGDNFICGGNTAITGHINITDNVHVGGLSGVSKSVTKPGQYQGYPLLPLKDHLKNKVSSLHIPEIRKQMNRVLKKLFPEDYQ